MIPVLGEYFRTGLVPRFPTLIVCCFVLVAALLLFISGIILSSQLAKDARDLSSSCRLCIIGTVKRNKPSPRGKVAEAPPEADEGKPAAAARLRASP